MCGHFPKVVKLHEEATVYQEKFSFNLISDLSESTSRPQRILLQNFFSICFAVFAVQRCENKNKIQRMCRCIVMHKIPGPNIPETQA
jgi:hypothetical protein